MNNTQWNKKSTGELEDFLKNKLALPYTENYNRAIAVWAAVDQKPALSCLCETAADVQAAVILAARKGLRISVRGGGHDWQGRALVDGGMVIDLSGMKKVVIDPSAKVADIEGGVTAMELVSAADPYDLVAVVGTSGAVGVAGFTLGGGYGLITPSHGLGADNLVSADIVLADGSLVTATEHEHQDLLWALRGGGGNFGVVTSMRTRLHPAGKLLAGFIMFPLAEAEQVLQGFGKIMDSAPDELYVLAATMETPDGSPVLMLSPIWKGDPVKGQLEINTIRQLGRPVMEQIAELRYKDVITSFSEFIKNGRSHYMKTLWLSTITPEIAAKITVAAHNRTSPASMISFFHLHGAPSRIPLANTSFGLRKEHYVLSIVADWDPKDEADQEIHKKWVDDMFNAISPHALPGGYINILGREDKKQIAGAHGINLERLKSVKQTYDPGKVFSAQPLAV